MRGYAYSSNNISSCKCLMALNLTKSRTVSRVHLGVFSNMQAASVLLLNAMVSTKGCVINQVHCGIIIAKGCSTSNLGNSLKHIICNSKVSVKVGRTRGMCDKKPQTYG